MKLPSLYWVNIWSSIYKAQYASLKGSIGILESSRNISVNYIQFILILYIMRLTIELKKKRMSKYFFKK